MRNFFRRYWLYTYRLLPTFFIGLAVYNVFMRYRKVEDVSVRYKNEQEKFFSRMTNILQLASLDYSNEVSRIRHIVYSYTYKSNDLTTVSNFDLPRFKNSSVPDSPTFKTNYQEVSDIEARYFVSDGVPLLDVDGFYYGVGDDFGFGEICFLSPRVVLTDNFRIRLKPRQSSLPVSSSPNPVQFAAMVDDTYPLLDYKPYYDRNRNIEDFLNGSKLNRRIDNDSRRNN